MRAAAESVDIALQCDLQGRLDIETQCRGFLDLAKVATVKLVELVFKEAAFLELFHKLYHGSEWQDGSATASILATLKDYFQDYSVFIDASYFKKCEIATRSYTSQKLRLTGAHACGLLAQETC